MSNPTQDAMNDVSDEALIELYAAATLEATRYMLAMSAARTSYGAEVAHGMSKLHADAQGQYRDEVIRRMGEDR